MTLKGKIAIVCAVSICAAGVLWMTTRDQRSFTTYSYSQFLDQVHSGQVASVVLVAGNSGAVEATCRLKDEKTARAVLPADYKDALRAMQDKFVNIEIRESSSEPLRFFMNATPFLLLLGIWVILMIGGFPNGLRRWTGRP